MSRGKYSPFLPPRAERTEDFGFNADRQRPAPYDRGNYDERTMFAGYDKDGFDRYGYSAFEADGTFVGLGQGVDRGGYTEDEYLSMSPEDFDDITFRRV